MEAMPVALCRVSAVAYLSGVARVVRRWFHSEAANQRPQSTDPNTGAAMPLVLPKSTASCPSCRGELDWDAIALQARRAQRMPLSLALARGNDLFRHKPSGHAPARGRENAPPLAGERRPVATRGASGIMRGRNANDAPGSEAFASFHTISGL